MIGEPNTASNQILYLCRKITDMTTVTINERASKGKMLLEILRKFEGEEFINFQSKPNPETRRAISDVKKGKVISCESVDDMMKKLNS
jgi:hypothetical protein